jgi:hypothetical protein
VHLGFHRTQRERHLPFAAHRQAVRRLRDCDVNRVIRAILPPVFLLFASCDPGMTIRQIGSAKTSTAASDPDEQVTVRVVTTHPLIGKNWYSPGIEVLNMSPRPITVTRVDLET